MNPDQGSAMNPEEEVLSSLDFVTTCDKCDDTASRVLYLSCADPACPAKFIQVVCGLHRAKVRHTSTMTICTYCGLIQQSALMVENDNPFDGNL